jgi:hypothetical protein
VCRAAVEEVSQRRERGADAHVVGDLPVLERDVEVGADEDPPAGDLRLPDRARSTHA